MILRLRSEALPVLKHKVGNERTFLFARNDWHPDGPLFQKYVALE